MPAVPRTRRYEAVMGDREPDITDKHFVRELQLRLEEKYSSTQSQKERRLADAETRRVRKLVLDGVIDPNESQRQDADCGKDEWKEFWPPNPYKTLAEYEEDRRRKAEEESRAQQQHQQQQEHQETHRSEAADGDAGETGQSPSGGADGGAGGGASGGGHEDHRRAAAEMPAGRYEGTQSPRIEELMSEEDLDQLYAKAADIVYIMAPPPKRTGKAKKQS